MMRKTLAPMLALALLALGLAGFAWSGPSPVQAEPQAPPAAPQGGLEENLRELFPEPVEASDGCRCAECRAEHFACKDACPPIGTPEGDACHEQCYSDFLACKSVC